ESAVRKRIARLENHLGAHLLNRTTRRLNMTEIGAFFNERAARIVAEAGEVKLEISSLHVAPYGTLEINTPCHSAFSISHRQSRPSWIFILS
ncbi:MAG: LysR family transcriptional regulator, partial [Rhodospirillales bacterium]|nr:LysR family transcriptional regulator [Rhodospirillales bacterium]